MGKVKVTFPKCATPLLSGERYKIFLSQLTLSVEVGYQVAPRRAYSVLNEVLAPHVSFVTRTQPELPI